MEIIKVGICLDDIRFAHALSRGLARECKNMTFFLLDQVNEGKACDLILSSQEHSDHRVVAMIRDGEDENIFGTPPYRVYRYKESKSLINDLLFIYFKITGKTLEFIGDTECKLLVFAAVAGGCGTTSVALCVGQMLDKLYGCRCLYLNLCPIDDSKKYLHKGGDISLLKLLYYLDTHKNFPLDSFITFSRDIDYINTNLINSYFDELKSKLLFQLLKKIDGLGKYSFLIVDMSNHLSRTNKILLQHASHVVLLRSQQNFAPGKYFDDITQEIESRMEKGTLIKVNNFVDELWQEEEDILSISWEKYTICQGEDGLLDLSQMNHFAMEVSTIARKIMEEGDGGIIE